jgi:hypothetical protein
VTVDGSTVGGKVYDSPIGFSDVVSIQKNGKAVSTAPIARNAPTMSGLVRRLTMAALP